MSTETLVKKLNNEVKTLKNDVREMKSTLLKILAVPGESIEEYRNATSIKKALKKARKIHQP